MRSQPANPVQRLYNIGVPTPLRLLPLLTAAALSAGLSQQPSGLAGRWDLTITTPKGTYPSWLEVNEQQAQPAVRVVGRVASVHPATEVKREGSKLTFTTSEWFGKPIPVTWEVQSQNGTLTGVQHRSDGVEGKLTGVHAPDLRKSEPATWTQPVPLFNGKDLTGWVPDNPATNHWRAVDGVLVNEKAGANLRTTRKFNDVKLHIEFNCPQGGNSGIYLRGRYEIQVAYEPPGTNNQLHDLGSIYGFLAPAKAVAPQPGQWESFDVTLVGRTVTVIRNGVTTIDKQEIPGITGGALDSREGEPGPFYIQGDHTGGMKYRNITVSVPKK